MSKASTVVDRLGLEGHDSELFSFLNKQFVDDLQRHAMAERPLWTFGSVQDNALSSVAFWNGPGCIFSTHEPDVVKGSDSFISWVDCNGCKFTTNQSCFAVTALTAVRYLFVHSYSAIVDSRRWVAPVDPGLERLRYIRGYKGYDRSDTRWMNLKARFFDWSLMALETIR